MRRECVCGAGRLSGGGDICGLAPSKLSVPSAQCQVPGAQCPVPSALASRLPLPLVVSLLSASTRSLPPLPPNERFEVVVSEILGSDPLSEGVLPTLAHARANLAVPGALWAPSSLTLHAALARSGALGAALGSAAAASARLAVRAFGEALAPARLSCHLPDVPGAALLSDALLVATLPLDGSVVRGAGDATAVVTASGLADAVLVWFTATFDGGASVSTGPHDGRRPHWRQTLYRIAAPLALDAGDCVRLRATFAMDRLAVTAQKEA